MSIGPIIITTIIYPLTMEVIGAPKMTLQPVPSIFFSLVLHCHLGLCELQACPFLDVFPPLFMSWAVGRSSGSIREELRRSRHSRVTQLVSTRHHWADVITVPRLGPDGRKGSTNELNGHVFDLERGGLRQVVPCP